MRVHDNINGLFLFDTSIGTCGIAWSEKGITRVVIGARKTKSANGRPPVWVKGAADRIARHLDGKPDPFDGIELDLSRISPFARTVYTALRRVPEGTTITYEDLARLAGRPKAARAVGRAMSTNPVPLIIPCHRVVASNGTLGGFSAHGGTALKSQLLAIEGAAIR